MDNETSALQYYRTRPKALVTFNTPSVSAKAAKFRVTIPDSRLRFKITVVFVPIAGDDPESGFAGASTIWLSESEDDYSGVTGRPMICNDIEGTQAAPTAFPVNSPSFGYSREFVTAADNIEGSVSLSPGSSGIGTWVVQCRAQPNNVRFTAEEWKDIVSRITVVVTQGPFNVA